MNRLIYDAWFDLGHGNGRFGKASLYKDAGALVLMPVMVYVKVSVKPRGGAVKRVLCDLWGLWWFLYGIGVRFLGCLYVFIPFFCSLFAN